MALPIRVLLLEDVEDEAILLVRELRRGGLTPDYERVETEEEFRAAMERQRWDVILADYSLPRFNGLAALEIARHAGSDVPFIFASGAVHPDVVVQGMALGANDYVLKDDLTRLVPAVERELQQARAREGRRAAEEALHRSESQFRALFEHAAIGINMGDPETRRILRANPAFQRMVGYTEAELRDSTFMAITMPEDVERERPLYEELVHGVRNSYELEKRYIHRNSAIVWARLTVSMVRDAEGRPLFDTAIVQDITEQRRDQKALRASEKRYRQMFEGNQAIKLLIDPEARTIVDANSAAAQYYGYPLHELQCMPLSTITVLPPGQMRAQISDAVQGSHIAFEFQHRLASDEIRDVEVYSSPIDVDGKTLLYSIVHDVTERKRHEEQLRHQALHDSLTGLPNRTLFLDRVTQAVRGANRAGDGVAVLLLDLDGFKDVNDGLGLHIGDALLQEVGRRLSTALRESDTVARLGGDEFGILLPDTDEAGATKAANKVLGLLSDPCDLEGQVVYPAASLGVALFPLHSDDPTALLRHADVAMYRAKQSATGFAIYEQETDPQSKRRLQLTAGLRKAIDGNELTLHYQPKVDLRSRTGNRVEALVRWIHPELGIIPPDQFIGLAEHTGLIRPLTLWVLDTAVQQVNRWTVDGLDIHVAVNLSVWNLQDPGLDAEVAAVLRRWNVPAERLVLEITESAIMFDPERAMRMVSRLHDLGVRISIDDFGTGYSSLAYLLRLPVDEIKIDRSFVMNMHTTSDESAIIVRSVVDLGQNLKRRTVAEGVQTQAQLEILTQLGCDFGQGYFLSRPVTADEYVAWLCAWNAAVSSPSSSRA